MPSKKISELDERLNLYSDFPFEQIPSSSFVYLTGDKDSDASFMIARSGSSNEKITYKNLKTSVLDNAVFLTGNQLVSGAKVFSDACTFLSRVYINEIIDITQTGSIHGHIFVGESGLYENIGVGKDFFSEEANPQDVFHISGSSLFDGTNSTHPTFSITGNLKQVGTHETIGNSWYSGEVRITGDSFQEGDISFQGDRDIEGDINQTGNADFQAELTVSGNIRLGEYLHHHQELPRDTFLRFTGGCGGGNSIELQAGGEAKIQITDDFISFSTSGEERVRMIDNGFLGINTKTPMGELSVTGDAYLERIKLWDGEEWVNVYGGDDETVIFKTNLWGGSDSYLINFPKHFSDPPIVSAVVENSDPALAIPFQILDVTQYNYKINFGSYIPDNHYSVLTAVMSTGLYAKNTMGIQRFQTKIARGQSSYKIDYPGQFADTPIVTATIDGDSPFTPYVISGVSSSHYYVSFGAPTLQDYTVHTISSLSGKKHLSKGGR
jgi:hypothetical protein